MDTATTSGQLDGGKAILEAFRRLGVDYIFSSPGSEWAPVWEAVAHQKAQGVNGPGFIDCWHETLAADMAIGYSLSTGRMQALLIHAGAGLLQGAMGVHGALQTEVPMLIMSGESLAYGETPDFDPGSQWVRNLSVVGGPHRLIEPLVKYANQITSIETLYESVVRAGEMSQRTPRAPVFLNVPVETMLEPWTPPVSPRQIPEAPVTVTPGEDIQRLADQLVAAECPVVITDALGRDTGAWTPFVEIAERLALPVIEDKTLFANFPRDNPLHQGSDISPFWEEMDLALVIDSRVPWYPPSNRPPHANVVVIDETPHREHMVYQSLQADAYLEGNLRRTLIDLSAAISDRKIDTAKVEARRTKLTEAHNALDEKLAVAVAESADKSPIDPAWLYAKLGDVLPADTIYVEELTTHGGAMRRFLRFNHPGTLYSRQGGLGQGIGLALGAKLAQPDKMVTCVIGDGAFLYNPALQALGASRDYNLPVLIVVLNNSKYAAMQGITENFYPDGAAVTTDTHYGVHINGPDYADIAQLFDGHGEKVEDPARLAGAIEDAQKAVAGGKTAILNIMMSR